MSWSVPDRDLAAAIDRRLRASLGRRTAPDLPYHDVVSIDVLRVAVPENATADQVAARVTRAIAGRLGKDRQP